MDLCPDNSTESLLRALLATQTENNNEYNWDPLTFRFTATIGIIAAILAILAVWQGLLNAGVGRIKANRRAIGDFSKHTTHEFSWREFRFRTMARTPYISIPSLHNGGINWHGASWAIHEKKSRDIRNEHARKSAFAFFKRPNRFLRKASEEDEKRAGAPLDLSVKPKRVNKFAATWSNLLAEFSDSMNIFAAGPSDIEASTSYNTSRTLTTVAAKQLLSFDAEFAPSDLFAAPTLGTVESIVTIAALAGCDEIVMEEKRPLARGHNMQLSFRDRPQLGVVAVYQKLPRIRTYLENGDIAARFTESSIEPGRFDMMSVSRHFAVSFLVSGTVTWPGVYTYSSMNVLGSIKQLCQLSTPWSIPDSRAILAALHKGLSSKGYRFYWSESRHYPRSFLYDLDKLMRARCPSDRASTFSNDFDPEISGRISRYKNTSWHIKHHDRPVLSHILHHDHRVQQIGKGESVASSDIQSIIFDGNDLSGQRTNGHVLRETDIKGQDYLIVAPVSMRICLQFLKDPSLFRKFSFDERSNMRGALRHQLHQIDVLLAHMWDSHEIDIRNTLESIRAGLDLQEERKIKRQNAQKDAASHKSRTQTREMDSLRDAQKHAGPSNTHDGDQDTNDEAQHSQTAAPEDDPLRAILVFRAVVMAAFLSTAADISPVAGTELGKLVVHML